MNIDTIKSIIDEALRDLDKVSNTYDIGITYSVDYDFDKLLKIKKVDAAYESEGKVFLFSCDAIMRNKLTKNQIRSLVAHEYAHAIVHQLDPKFSILMRKGRAAQHNEFFHLYWDMLESLIGKCDRSRVGYHGFSKMTKINKNLLFRIHLLEMEVYCKDVPLNNSECKPLTKENASKRLDALISNPNRHIWRVNN